METSDYKIVDLKHGNKKYKVKVYLEDVTVRNNHHNVKPFCRID